MRYLIELNVICKIYYELLVKYIQFIKRGWLTLSTAKNIFTKHYSSWLTDIGMAISSHYIDCCWSRERLEVLTSSMCD